MIPFVPAPKGRDSKAQGEGARENGALNPGYKAGSIQALKGRHRIQPRVCYAAPSGLEIRPPLPRAPAGFAASALGFAVPRFQRWDHRQARNRFSCYRSLETFGISIGIATAVGFAIGLSIRVSPTTIAIPAPIATPMFEQLVAFLGTAVIDHLAVGAEAPTHLLAIRAGLSLLRSC